MSVSAKERKALQKMWERSSDHGGGVDIEDGTYQFKITKAKFEITSNGRPRVVRTLKVVGGDRDAVGKTFNVFDNVETEQNMAWFKKTCSRLGVPVPKSFDDIIDGDTLEEMAGRVFEGKVAWKNDFLNVYVNKLIGTGVDDDEPEDEEDEEDEGDDEEDSEDSEDEEESEDDEDDEDDESDDEEDGESDDDDEDESDDEEEPDELEWPESVDEVSDLSLAEARQLLEAVEIRPGRQPKAILATAVAVINGDFSTLQSLKKLAAAMGASLSASDTVAKATRKVRKELSAHVEF